MLHDKLQRNLLLIYTSDNEIYEDETAHALDVKHPDTVNYADHLSANPVTSETKVAGDYKGLLGQYKGETNLGVKDWQYDVEVPTLDHPDMPDNWEEVRPLKKGGFGIKVFVPPEGKAVPVGFMSVPEGAKRDAKVKLASKMRSAYDPLLPDQEHSQNIEDRRKSDTTPELSEYALTDSKADFIKRGYAPESELRKQLGSNEDIERSEIADTLKNFTNKSKAGLEPMRMEYKPDKGQDYRPGRVEGEGGGGFEIDQFGNLSRTVGGGQKAELRGRQRPGTKPGTPSPLRGRDNWDPDLTKSLNELKDKGLTLAEIAKELGITRGQVAGKLFRQNLVK